ncbi:hypothetical protein R6Q59_036007 [Mikania micrantha]
MSNRTLDDHLHKLRTPLSWFQRLNICIGAGRGLHYLHTGTGIATGVIHRDVKSSNILLHESWAAKISDFGLSKIGPTNQPSTYVNTHIKGTFGYLDPNYYTTGKLTRKSDVYAFGVVLLEVLCRKRAVDKSLDEEQWGLVAWVQDSIKEGNLKSIIDSDIRGEISPKCLKEYVKLTERCLHNGPKHRPNMAEILFSLESVMAIQEKFNNSLQSASRTLFGRMVNLFPFSSNLENSATENFSESLVIGRGGFGKVYKGNIINGSSMVVAAIKRLDSMSNQGAAEFWAEVEMLSMLRHCNLVSLIGYCNYEQEMILVYEYMPNSTLNDHLHERRTPLSWLQRLNICTGTGRGLHYLHTGTGIASGVIHRDVKGSNILVHESWAAKISDFWLSKIGPTNQPSTYVNTLIKGTFGYVDPNYYATGKLTRKSDVYAFGVVLLEVLCRKRAVDKSLDEEQWGLVTWVQDSIKEGNLKTIIDSDIRDEISPKCLKEYVKLAERCLHNSPKQRPNMAEVLFSLESVMAVQEKFNNSLQSASRTLFGRMVNLFPFSSNQENSVQGDLNLSTNSKGNNMFPHMKEVPAHFPSPSPILKEFRFSDLEKATRSFSPDLILGVGSFGNVFLGWVKENTLAPSKQGVGIAVAVKRLNEESVQGAAEWQAEVNFLGHLAHPNIIRLLGYCREELEHLLVYEYMPNKSFDCFLFSVIAEPLSWGTRLLIMMGAVCGMTHLHSNDIVSLGLKSSDILLDKDFNAKLGDFGLVRKCGSETGETHVSTRVMGTCGYGAPEYIRTGRRAMDAQRPKGQKSLVEWATRVGPNLKKIMDPRLEGSGSDFGGKGVTSYGFYGSSSSSASDFSKNPKPPIPTEYTVNRTNEHTWFKGHESNFLYLKGN